MLRSVKIVVWDLDGTLYFNQELFKISRQKYRDFYVRHGGTARDFDTKEKAGIDWTAIIQQQVRVSAKKLLLVAEGRIAKQKFVEPNPKLVKAIEKLSPRQIIFTNATRSQAVGILKALGFSSARVFSHVLTLSDLPDAKPSTEAWQFLLKKIGSEKQVVYVGDNYHHDIVPAVEHGFKSIFINRWQQNVPHTGLVVNTHEELVLILATLQKYHLL